MSAIAEFDVFACPLDGRNLIEASAGTGKTWNICGLYLRLLLERGLGAQQILVVTFTNAATAELRERIRTRIVEVLAWLRDADASGEGAPGDPFVVALHRAVAARTGLDRPGMARILDQALQSFDEAAIFTIHGFCQRALADAAFSAGLPFTLELVTDDREMVLEAVHDFWRKHIAADTCPPALAAWLRQKKDTPEKYAKLLARSLAKPLATCRWAAVEGDASDTAAALTAFDAARALWSAQRDDIVDCVVTGLEALNKNSYKDESIAKAARDWDERFRNASPLVAIDTDSKLKLLSASTLAERTKKNCVPPSHPFFDAAALYLTALEAATASLERARLALLRTLIETVGPELRQRKRERRVIAFDDMLYNLYDALTSGAQPQLAATLRTRYPVALIDEFQDTDPLQFAIFEQLYARDALPAFFVGDPKQAIYRFRHADLHAYLRARSEATALYTLAANQRSTPGVIAALNGLFTATPDAFMLPGLDYQPVTAGAKPRKPFVDTSAPCADLQVWMLPTNDDGKPIAKTAASGYAARATAAEISRLIAAGRAGRVAIDGEPLAAADIAVLVRSHAQGSAVKEALAALGVGSVELSQASVFRSTDAEDLERVLVAVNEPSRDALLRAALATTIMGRDATAIAAIAADESALLALLERFAGYRDLWLRQGVGVMLRRFFDREGVAARMLRRDDGERRLTNLLHLAEQLHQAAATHPSPDALLRWLATQRREDSADEVAQLRLESDQNLVKIVTIHKAKGLEFPVVFCPYVWDGRTKFGPPKPEGREYHAADGTAVIDFRLPEEIDTEEKSAIDAGVRLEDAAETLRLIYVALTRAVYRCYLVAGTYTTRSFKSESASESMRSLLNWLAAGGSMAPEGWLEHKQPIDIGDAWRALAARLHPHLALAPLPLAAGTPLAPQGPAPESLVALSPPASIAPAWRIGSFSALMQDARGEAAADDRDAHIADATARFGAPPPAVAPDDILRFPRGPGAGDCLHAVFERIDFSDPTAWGTHIARALALHSPSPPGARAAEQVATMLGDVLSAALPDGIVLRAIPRARQLTELEFSVPSAHVTAALLTATLRSLGYDVPRLAFRDLEGYLRGFVDLVFEHNGRYYVLDWKSNHLGYTPADYGPAALDAAMAEHGYHLQYLLYSLAVDRHLRRCVPGYRSSEHFGGVLYLFVRGVRPAWRNADGTAAGVFHHRPTTATLARLDALFGAPPTASLP
jgi:exodeoxyribonuclease V beta subunit